LRAAPISIGVTNRGPNGRPSVSADRAAESSPALSVQVAVKAL
jgi:hypothetical protein